jgi:hypothetical protein
VRAVLVILALLVISVAAWPLPGVRFVVVLCSAYALVHLLLNFEDGGR